MNSKNSKNKSVKSVTPAKRGVGRPKYVPMFPSTARFTFEAFLAKNQARDTAFNATRKEGEKEISIVTPLTLRKWLKRDAARKGKSEVVLWKNKLADPSSEAGLGRKKFVYSLRSKYDPTADKKATSQKSLKSAKASKVSVTLTDSPAPAPVATPAPVTEASPAIVAPVAAIAPEVAPVTETPAPVAETPAPVAAEPVLA